MSSPIDVIESFFSERAGHKAHRADCARRRASARSEGACLGRLPQATKASSGVPSGIHDGTGPKSRSVAGPWDQP
jgi:hypothetical protein